MPFSFYDSAYGNFYRSISKILFHDIGESGFSIFNETKQLEITSIRLGNNAQVKPDGVVSIATSEFNTRFRGYIPTVLFLSLVLASPVSIKRKLSSSIGGFVIITSAIMIKQWIHLLYIYTQAKWLNLYEFSLSEEKLVISLYKNIANYNGPTIVFAIAVWLVFTFYKSDLKIFLKETNSKTDI